MNATPSPLPLNGPWHWQCTAHGGLRLSTWVLKDKDGNNVIEETKGIELVKRDAHVRAIARIPELLAALQTNVTLLDNITSMGTYVDGALDEAIANTRRLLKGIVP